MFVGTCPVRISFAGGGTDLPEFYEEYGGNVIATTINHFTYVVIHNRRDKSFQAFSPDFQKHYKPTKLKNIEVEDGTEIASAIVKFLKFKDGIDVVLYSDVPAGSGLGASSSLAVNLVNTLTTLRGKKLTNVKIAETAFKVERTILKWSLGKQDEYLTSTGGFNFLEFTKNKVKVKPIRMNNVARSELDDNLLLFFVGLQRNSSNILSNQIQNIVQKNEDTIKSLKYVKELTLEMYDSLHHSDITKFGELLHKGWMAKKNFSKDVSNKKIDKMYDSALKFGALGGKLTGAGGGGHLLLYCEKHKQTSLILKLEKLGLRHINFKFYSKGPKVLDLYKQVNR